jgi:[ribosomal protein S5]-alanine N-acetyltransferase
MAPELVTPRLRLRGMLPSDAAPVHSIWTDPDVLRHLGPTDEISLDEVRRAMTRLAQHWERHGFGQWAVESRDDEQLIGYCGFKLWDGEGSEVELVYGLLPAYWHRGRATEAVQAALDAAFADLNLQRVVAGVLPENAASVRVLIKAGLHFERHVDAVEGRIAVYAIDRPVGSRGAITAARSA